MQYHGTDPNGAGGYVNPWVNRFAIWGESSDNEGVIGTSGKGDGVWGATNGPVGFGVYGQGPAVGVAGAGYVSAVWGIGGNPDGIGVQGEGGNGDGVSGKSDSGQGLSGESKDGYGVFGYSENSDAITGYKDAAGSGAAGNFSSLQLSFSARKRPTIVLGKAGSFWGHVDINGNLTVSGSKGFKIDHPLEPDRKFLYHSSVESPDMKNIYDGVVVLGRDGGAVISLPSWFCALNKDFRYQLTSIGCSAPNLHIAQKIRENKFRIAGGKPEMEVSWQVTGIRQDAWANAHRLPVEERKREDLGRLLHPDLHDTGGKDLSSVLYLEGSQLLKRIGKIKDLAAKRDGSLKKSANTIQKRIVRSSKARKSVR